MGSDVLAPLTAADACEGRRGSEVSGKGCEEKEGVTDRSGNSMSQLYVADYLVRPMASQTKSRRGNAEFRSWKRGICVPDSANNNYNTQVCENGLMFTVRPYKWAYLVKL